MHGRGIRMQKLQAYLRIREAAEYFGASPAALRNTRHAGKIAEHRHPVNQLPAL